MAKVDGVQDVNGDAPQRYIDDMVRKRGYVLNYHKYMAKADYDVLVAANGLVDAVYLKPRLLDRKTKELLFILSLTVMRAEKSHITGHIRVALQLGLSPAEILEAIEIALPEAGVVAFQGGMDAWREAVGAAPLEPSPGIEGAVPPGDNALDV
ncbi:MAG: 4-carboxymuconolactone decarboxylase [Chloroflexota bacterium]|jgi:4-carboxymuconolactone decarboxylase|nr:4-carboxymuconolactone decarboxylase [Chloroflexota bacterium]